MTSDVSFEAKSSASAAKRVDAVAFSLLEMRKKMTRDTAAARRKTITAGIKTRQRVNRLREGLCRCNKGAACCSLAAGSLMFSMAVDSKATLEAR